MSEKASATPVPIPALAPVSKDWSGLVVGFIVGCSAVADSAGVVVLNRDNDVVDEGVAGVSDNVDGFDKTAGVDARRARGEPATNVSFVGCVQSTCPS